MISNQPANRTVEHRRPAVLAPACALETCISLSKSPFFEGMVKTGYPSITNRYFHLPIINWKSSGSMIIIILVISNIFGRTGPTLETPWQMPSQCSPLLVHSFQQLSVRRAWFCAPQQCRTQISRSVSLFSIKGLH